MKSPKTLYIHAGMGKTGSTSIQNMFYFHRDYFREKGICYPFTGKLQCHHDLVSDYFENKIFWNTTDDFVESLKEEIKIKNPKKCLLSSELLYLRLDKREVAELIKEIFPGYHIRVIVYIRRADKWLPSAYKQLTMEFEYHELNKKFMFVDHIEKLAGIKEAFGINNSEIIIRPFETQQFYQNNLLKDILNIVRIEDSGNIAEEVQPANVKAHLNLDIIEYVRQMTVSASHLDPVEWPAWRQMFLEYPCPKEYEDVSLFGSYENLKETMDCYAPMYEHIARQYLGREDGKMFYEDSPPDKEHFMPYPGLSIEKAVQINGYLNYKVRQECITQIKALEKWTLKNIIITAINKLHGLLKRS